MAEDQHDLHDFQFYGRALSSLDPNVSLERLQEKAFEPCPNCVYLIEGYLGVHALENFIPQQQKSVVLAPEEAIEPDEHSQKEENE